MAAVNPAEHLESERKRVRAELKHNGAAVFRATILAAEDVAAMIDGPDIKTAAALNRWADSIRAAVRDNRGVAVVMAGEFTAGVYSRSGSEKLKILLSQGIHLSIDEAARAGLCRKVSSIIAVLQTPLGTTLVVRQAFERVGRKLKFSEPVTTHGNGDGPFAMLKVDFFGQPPASTVARIE